MQKKKKKKTQINISFRILHTEEQTVYLAPILIQIEAIGKIIHFLKKFGFSHFPQKLRFAWHWHLHMLKTSCEKSENANQLLLRKWREEWVDISEIEGPLIGKGYQYISSKTPKRQQGGSLTKFNIVIEKK